MIAMDYCYTRNISIIYKDLPDGPVLIDPYRRTMVPLDQVGADIWRLLDGTRPSAAIVETIRGSFETEGINLEKDIGEFLAELLKREMIR